MFFRREDKNGPKIPVAFDLLELISVFQSIL
jgi:hypothetical protein